MNAENQCGMLETLRRRLLLSLGLLLAGSLPALAQSQGFVSLSSASGATLLNVRQAPATTGAKPRESTAAPIFSTRVEMQNLIDLKRPMGSVAPMPFQHRDHIHSYSVESLAHVVETPFAEEIQLPLVIRGKGRLEFDGFYSQQQMDNFLWGPPGSGNLRAWSLSAQNHPGAWGPISTETFGLSVTIHLDRGAGPSTGSRMFRCLGRVVGARHGCL